MFGRKLMIAVCAAASAAVAFAQTPAQPTAPAKTEPAKSQSAAAPSSEIDGGTPVYLTPETPQQRKQRLGTAEDPGLNPDPNKHYWRFGKSYHIEKFDRRWASFDEVEPGFVRAFARINVQNELYQMNDKYVWVWLRDVSKEDLEPTTPAENSRYNAKQIEFFKRMRSEFFDTEPKQSDTVIRFEESSQGLPTGNGSWRNSGAVADMNGDGCPDIVAPPERKGSGVPEIYLGDCKGHWTYWQNVKWPSNVVLDYGAVVAADFNKDGHMDLAFSIHLTGVVVMLGDGKGNFTLSSEGLPSNFPTRRLVVADMDRDGYPDLVVINEGPTGVRRKEESEYSRLRVYLNRNKGTKWVPVSLSPQDRPVGGDYLAVGDLNGDKIPDVVGSSIFFNGNNTVFLSKGKAAWEPYTDTPGDIVPYLSYYYADTMGHFSSPKTDDAIVSYIRFWPTDLDPTLVNEPPARTVVGIDRISFSGKEPKRTPIERWSGNIAIWAMAAGDFNGDGNLDVIYTRYDPREAVILLGNGKGGFTKARVEGLTLSPNANYDIKIADVNGDGRPDVILMYEASARSALAMRDGSIHVFLNKGPVNGSAKTAAK